jgi:hypothetical protein
VDATDVLDLFDRLGPAAEPVCHAVSRVTAERVQQEARARARRRTGRLIEAIDVEEMGPPMHGYRVFVDEMTDARGRRPPEFPFWHEEGTKHMSAQPFMNNSAALEEGPHLRRISDALQDLIDEENS